MAEVVAAVKTFSAWLGTKGIAQTIVKTALTFAVTTAAQRLLMKKPQAGDFQNEAARRLTTVRASAEPRRVIYGEMRAGGVITYGETHGEDNKFLNLIITLTGHEVNDIKTVLWGETELTWKSGSDGDVSNSKYFYPGTTDSLIFVSKNNGSDSQLADTDLTGITGISWDANNRQRGCAHLYVRLHGEQEKVADLQNITAIIEGKKVYDPRTMTTVYSKNAALCCADWLTDTRFGFGIPYSDIDETSLIAAANVCDENVNLNPSGTEKRYQVNGTISSDMGKGQVLQDLANAMAGSVVFSDGKYFINAGKYTAPTITLTDDHLRDGLNIKVMESASEACNCVRGIYSNPGANYQTDDFPVVKNATYLTEDGGTEYWREIELPFTTSPGMAQRLSKIELERSRQEIIVTFPAQLHAIQLKAGDTVAIDNTRMGWTGKVFDVLEMNLANDGGYIGVDLTLRETASTVYDWALGEETVVDPAPNTNLPDPETVPAPTSLTVDSGGTHLVAKGDGTIISRAKMAWTAPASEFSGRIEIEYKKNADADWISQGIFPAQTVEHFISDVEDGVAYDFQLRSISVLGRKSSWVQELNHTIVGKEDNPATPTGFSLDAGDQLTFSVTATMPNEADLSRFRVAVDDNASFTNAFNYSFAAEPSEIENVEISRWKNGTYPLEGFVNGTTYYFRVRAVDSSGNVSPWTATLSAAADNSGLNTGPPGGDGDSVFFASIFRRDSSTPATPTGGSYNFGTKTITTPSGWTSSPASSATESLYISTATFSVNGTTGIDSGPTWSAPQLYVEDGYSYYQAQIFKRSASTPATPTGGSYNFTTKVFTAPAGGWSSAPTGAGTDPWYSSTAVFSVYGNTGTDSTPTWESPGLFAQDGADGAAGLNNATVLIYQRTNTSSAPSVPSVTATYTFSTGAISGLNNSWTDEPPAYSTGYHWLWTTVAAASSTSSSDTIANSEWTNPPRLLSIDGSRTATGLVYYTIEQAGAPATPTATSYNFTTGAFTGLTANWQDTPVEVIISDTTTKYWTSRYTVEEDMGTGTETITFQTATGSINFGTDIQSDNFATGVSGWQLQRDTGNLEANDGTFRGKVSITDPTGGSGSAEETIIEAGKFYTGTSAQDSGNDPLGYVRAYANSIIGTNYAQQTIFGQSDNESNGGYITGFAQGNNTGGSSTNFARLLLWGNGSERIRFDTNSGILTNLPIEIRGSIPGGAIRAKMDYDSNGGAFYLNNDLGNNRVVANVNSSDNGQIYLYNSSASIDIAMLASAESFIDNSYGIRIGSSSVAALKQVDSFTIVPAEFTTSQITQTFDVAHHLSAKPETAFINCTQSGYVCGYDYDNSTSTNCRFWVRQNDNAAWTGLRRFAILIIDV